ncbi:glycosyltransferase family 2 protein [Aliiglaciecola litoralis]|uniref:Glycosyl transferase family 2 n=1 Tax=Aliiglaciecola litoralis TaxID=582857 RepID=A0ABN1LJH8_9ALTE
MITRKLQEKLSITYARMNFRLRKDNPKVKLVAIAKDESAYLVDWIFHHLYFGFDELVIYVNNTSDNTNELIDALASEHHIRFESGDPYFQQSLRAPQMAIYLDELRKSRLQGFTHLMFLDVDEFYTPLDFTLNIKDFIKTSESADVYCFEWVHKMDEYAPFAAPFTPNLVGRRAQQVKSLVATYIEPLNANPHNFLINTGNYKLADGAPFEIDKENYSKVPLEELAKPLKPVFVLHRMTRHPLEYIAALKRGRPLVEGKQGSQFKNNRSGIFNDDSNITVNIPSEKVIDYQHQKQLYISKRNLESVIEKGREMVISRYHDVISMIKGAPESESATLTKILKNVDLPEVKQAHEEFLQNHQL